MWQPAPEMLLEQAEEGENPGQGIQRFNALGSGVWVLCTGLEATPGLLLPPPPACLAGPPGCRAVVLSISPWAPALHPTCATPGFKAATRQLLRLASGHARACSIPRLHSCRRCLLTWRTASWGQALVALAPGGGGLGRWHGSATGLSARPSQHHSGVL